MLIKRRLKNSSGKYYYELCWDPKYENGFYPYEVFNELSDGRIETTPVETPELALQEVQRIEERIQKIRNVVARAAACSSNQA